VARSFWGTDLAWEKEGEKKDLPDLVKKFGFTQKKIDSMKSARLPVWKGRELVDGATIGLRSSADEKEKRTLARKRKVFSARHHPFRERRGLWTRWPSVFQAAAGKKGVSRSGKPLVKKSSTKEKEDRSSEKKEGSCPSKKKNR